MMYLISIDTVVISNLLSNTIATCIEEDLLIFVFLWVQNVVAVPTKLHSTHFRKSLFEIEK
nr:hypothetical protein Iba_scaffold3961.4CG1210 [Ipomoea batatas]